ncbi:MAG: hypothetical protein WCK49_05340 [Myxococcaceae bacterium]
MKSSSLPNFQELRTELTQPESPANLSLDTSRDSFTRSAPEKKTSQLIRVYSANKNTAGDTSAAVTGSGATVIKHGATVLDHTSRIIATSSTIAPVGSVAGAGINLFKDAHIQKIVEGRFEAVKALYIQVCETHFKTGLSALDSSLALADLHSPSKHALSACETTIHTLAFALMKMGNRISRLKIQQTGSSIAIAGATAAVAGSTLFGFGAIPGIAVAAVGSAVNLTPTFHAMGKAVYKNIQGTKGVDRKSSAYFIWALSLRKAVHENQVSRDQIRENKRAVQAFCFAEEWVSLRTQEDIMHAQNIAFLFLERLGVMRSKSLEGLDLSHSKYLEKVENRLKSTPNV